MVTKVFNMSFLFLLILAQNIKAQSQNLENDFRSLVSVERAFAKTSELIGTRDAFLTFFEEDAIVFAPKPVSVVEVYKDRSQSSSSLLWYPTYAEIAASGDFGFTTGPWEFRQNKNDQSPAANGHYVTVWKRGEYGLWKVVIDCGISHPAPENKIIEEINFLDCDRIENNKIKSDAAKDELLKNDINFCVESKVNGFKSAFEKFASENVRLYRNGDLPFRSKAYSLQALDDIPVEWEPAGGDAALAGDIGYTYGSGDDCSYFRIWRNNGSNEWKLIIDLLTPYEANK